MAIDQFDAIEDVVEFKTENQGITGIQTPTVSDVRLEDEDDSCALICDAR